MICFFPNNMMRSLKYAGFIAVLFLTACSEQKQVSAPPPPQDLTSEAAGYYCGMSLVEHKGPKGQIFVKDAKVSPLWFSSVRDTIAFTMLPEEPKELLALYVSDMGKAESWDRPGIKNWIDAKTAFYVIEGTARGGMGAAEAVPFSERTAAEAFIKEQGGRIVSFEEIPQNYILGSDTKPDHMSGEAMPH